MTFARNSNAVNDFFPAPRQGNLRPIQGGIYSNVIAPAYHGLTPLAINHGPLSGPETRAPPREMSTSIRPALPEFSERAAQVLTL